MSPPSSLSHSLSKVAECAQPSVFPVSRQNPSNLCAFARGKSFSSSITLSFSFFFFGEDLFNSQTILLFFFDSLSSIGGNWSKLIMWYRDIKATLFVLFRFFFLCLCNWIICEWKKLLLYCGEGRLKKGLFISTYFKSWVKRVKT